MKTCKQLLCLTLLLAYFLFTEAKPPITEKSQVRRSWALQGQGLEVISREDPRSPFFNPNDGRYDVLSSAIARSWSRLRDLNSKVASVTSPLNTRTRIFQDSFRQGPAGGGVSAPPSTGAEEYFVSLKVGTPAKEVLLTIDTGSEISWMQCTPCVYCYQQLLPVFNPYASSTYVSFNCVNPNCNSSGGVFVFCSVGDNSCAYESSYGDGSLTLGTLSTDTFTFSSANGSTVAVPNIIFGCGRWNEGLFVGNSGLLGLDKGTFSFATQLKDVFGQTFSFCYVDRLKKPNGTSFLFFGETDTKGLSFTPLQSVPGGADLYYLNFTGISVGDTNVRFKPEVLQLSANGTGGTIIDSGTYITFLPDVVYTPLESLFLNMSKLTIAPISNSTIGLDFCFNFPAFPPKTPTVTFHFQNVDLVFDAYNIFIGPFDTRGELYCFAFVNAGPISGSIAVIVGNVQQQNFRIEYDLKNSRIGFEKTDCAAS